MKFNAVIAACILSFVAYGQCAAVQNGDSQHPSSVNATGHPHHQQGVPHGATVSGDKKHHGDHHQPSDQVKRQIGQDASGAPPQPTTQPSGKHGKAHGDKKKHHSKRQVAENASGPPPQPTTQPSGKHGKAHGDKKKHHSKRQVAENASGPPPQPTTQPSGKHGDKKKHHSKSHADQGVNGTPSTANGDGKQ